MLLISHSTSLSSSIYEDINFWEIALNQFCQTRHLLGLFGLAIVPEVPAIGPNLLKWRNRCLPITGVNFKPMPSI